jgi:VWFA-related protein
VVELVLVPVTVLASDGTPLRDLSSEEFSLFEDDARQQVATFDSDTAQVSLVFGLDCSGSMQNVLPFVKAAAITFLQKLPPRFSAAFFAFDERPGPLVDFTLDRSHLYYEIGRRQARGTGTAILGACRAALSALRSRAGRKAAAIFTDGEETQLPEESHALAARELADEARRADVEIHFVVYGRETRSPLTEAIASGTGGESLPGGSPRRVSEAFSRIGARLGAQYTLGYRPRTPATPGSWRRLRVEVARPGASVAARPGWGVPGAPGS